MPVFPSCISDVIQTSILVILEFKRRWDSHKYHLKYSPSWAIHWNRFYVLSVLFDSPSKVQFVLCIFNLVYPEYYMVC